MRQTEEDAMKNIRNAGSCQGKLFLRIPGRARASNSLDLMVGKREIQAERNPLLLHSLLLARELMLLLAPFLFTLKWRSIVNQRLLVDTEFAVSFANPVND